jgi:adenylylsulfate kinase-like enzyme
MGAIHRVIPADKEGTVFWFHGNSGSGKTKLALQYDVPNKVVLDADDLREVWTDLEFTEGDRWEQNLRLARLARILWIQGFNVCVASICPYADLRRTIRKEILPEVRWVYINSPASKKPSEEYPFEEGGWSI